MNEERLLTCIREENVPHAILIAGVPGSGRAALARRAAAVYCLDADAPDQLLGCPHYSELSGEAVGVAEVRALMAATAMQGFNGQKRAFVLTNAHRISRQSQNALLKTLEEPPQDTLLILSGNEEGLLPTVRSRCMVVRLGAKSVEEAADMLEQSGVDTDTARLAASLSGGVTGRAAMYAGAEYLSFRKKAITLFERALFAASPFQDAVQLITSVGDEEDAAAGDGRKRGKRADAGLMERMLDVWRSIARDALVTKLDGGNIADIDEKSLTDRIASRFTTGQIQGIIDILGTAQERLIARASPRTTLDVMLARLHIKEKADS